MYKLIIVYFSILLIAFFVSFSKIKSIIKHYRKDLKNGKIKYGKIPEKFLRKHIGENNIDKLKSIKPLFITQIVQLADLLFLLINLPIFILRMSIAIRFGGAKITWKLPVSLYELWNILILGFCFHFTSNGFYNYSIILSSIVIFVLIVRLSSNLNTTNKGLSIEDIPDHKFHISELVIDAIIVILGFASIYHAFSNLNSNSFGENLSIIDSIYFSFMLGTTVGLGHIHPSSDIVKIITIIEAFLGFMFVVFIVSVYINVWIQKKNKIDKSDEV
jgi:hypothetical protein